MTHALFHPISEPHATALNGPGRRRELSLMYRMIFQVQGWASFFLFATLDGTISPPQANRNEAILAVDNSANKSWRLPVRASGNLFS
jgi:hypothetical protein